jgi:hypothetical protein
MFISPQIMYSSVGLYNFLSIKSILFMNKLKFPEGALYIVIIQVRVGFKFSFKEQTSKSFSIQYISKSIVSKFRILCT